MLELTFHGHSFVSLTQDETLLLIDPFITYNATCDLSVQEVLEKKPTAIIITHGHSDHIGDTVEIAQQTGCLVIATVEVGQRMKQQGVRNVSNQHIGGSMGYGSYEVKFTPAFHGGRVLESEITWVAAGVLVRIGGKTIYHAGDTGLTIEMELLWRFEHIDIACLPIGGRYTMDAGDAVRAVTMIKPALVVPIHYNTWPDIAADALQFATEVMAQTSCVPKVLTPGQHIVLQE